MPRPDRLHFAEDAGIDDFFHGANLDHVSHIEADHRENALGLCGLGGAEDVVGLLDVDPQRLLAKQVLAGFKNRDGVLFVKDVRRADGHGVHVVAFEQPAIVVGDKRIGVDVFLKPLDGFRVRIRRRRHHRASLRIMPMLRQRPASRGRDHSDSQLLACHYRISFSFGYGSRPAAKQLSAMQREVNASKGRIARQHPALTSSRPPPKRGQQTTRHGGGSESCRRKRPPKRQV